MGGQRIRKVTLNGGFTCPNLDGTKGRGGCTYCDNRSFSPSAGNRNQSISFQLATGIDFLKSRLGAERFIAYFQTFSGTYAPIVKLKQLYTEALAYPDVVGISIGTRPDCIDEECIALLDSLGRQHFVTLELGLQSSFDKSLIRINRGHTFEEFSKAMTLCQGKSFDVCIHVILGLPGETLEDFRTTAQSLTSWHYQSIKIHPLHIVRGTELCRQWMRDEFQVLEFTEYIQGLVDFLERIPATVGVQRFTGDAPESMLMAPTWCRHKNAIRNAMISEFNIRKSHQGFAFQG